MKLLILNSSTGFKQSIVKKVDLIYYSCRPLIAVPDGLIAKINRFVPSHVHVVLGNICTPIDLPSNITYCNNNFQFQNYNFVCSDDFATIINTLSETLINVQISFRRKNMLKENINDFIRSLFDDIVLDVFVQYYHFQKHGYRINKIADTIFVMRGQSGLNIIEIDGSKYLPTLKLLLGYTRRKNIDITWRPPCDLYV